MKSEFNGVKQGGGILSAVLFSMYIDPSLVELSMSGYGCHLDGVYTGAPSYADDITISCPSIVGLNKMCDKLALHNSIIFKFGIQ